MCCLQPASRMLRLLKSQVMHFSLRYNSIYSHYVCMSVAVRKKPKSIRCPKATMIMYITLPLCSYFYQRDFIYSRKFQLAYFGLSYSWVRKIPWRRDRLPTPLFLGFPCGSAGKESAYNVGDLGSIPGLGRSPGEGKGYPLQYSGLENSMNCIVYEDAKSQTRLRDFHFLFCATMTTRLFSNNC